MRDSRGHSVPGVLHFSVGELCFVGNARDHVISEIRRTRVLEKRWQNSGANAIGNTAKKWNATPREIPHRERQVRADVTA
jgi:hypothetical protein